MTTIPCKRPKVTVDERTEGGTFDVNCHVPGCSWTYPADKQFMALKSDGDWQATRHRGEHRAAVPDTAILLAHDGHQAECDCGAKWLAPTKAHARTWLRHHLALDHGLVECP